MKNNKKGFTLIEILIVVLIVGVLVGVAVPQYQKSVMRARLAEAEVMMRSVVPAVEEYCLAQGSTNKQIDLSSLSIRYPVSEFSGLPVAWSSSGTSFTAVNGTCSTFLKNDLQQPSVFSYLFNKNAKGISSEDQLMQAMHSVLAMNRSGSRMCMPGPADPNSCAHLGFRLQTIDMGEVCNSSGGGCHQVTETVWTD